MFFVYFLVYIRGKTLIKSHLILRTADAIVTFLLRHAPTSVLTSLTIIAIFCGFANNSYALEYTFESSPFANTYANTLINVAELDKNRRVFMLWNLESEADSFSSSIDNYFYFQFKGVGKLRYDFMDRLSLNLQANVLFQGGQFQSRFNDLVPSGPAYLSYGYINYDVLDDQKIQLQAGALSQSEVFGSNVFISSRAFPGAGIKFGLGDSKMGFKAMVQETVPTTYTFSTNLAERENTPRLSTSKAGFYYKQNNIKLSMDVGIFDYTSLPSIVAQTSRLYGNSVDGTGFASEFVYDFRGWLTNFDLAYILNDDTTFRLAVDMLQNTSAPSAFNQSQAIQVSGHHRLNRTLGFDLAFTNFFVESDAVPAFFTSRSLGQTNRIGNAVEVGIQWLEAKVRLSAGYAVSNLINPDPDLTQLDNDIVTISLETAYDLFN